MKFDEKAIVISQNKLSDGIYDMWLETCNIAEYARAGQFVSVYTADPSKLLPRPISICETDSNRLRLVYRVVGEGTKQFSEYKSGDAVHIIGPLGNGYPLGEARSPILIGGGIGIPPMLELAKRLRGNIFAADDMMGDVTECENISIVLGYRNADTFLLDDLKVYGDVYIATDDGSLGIHGTVLDAIKANAVKGDIIYSCGPTPMLRAVSSYAAGENIKAYLSLEERMACGIGACLACVCKTAGVDEHSQVHNARICTDGPVFDSREVEL